MKATAPIVSLIGLIGCTEHVVQFADQFMHFGCRLDYPFDGDAHP
jgi:hypothetical protein